MADTVDAAPERLRSRVTWLISQTGVHSHRLLSDALASADSRGYHYRLLAALDEFGPSSQAALGCRTDLDRSDVAEALNELSARDLVERSADPLDRRRNIVAITRAGTRQLQRLDELVAEVQDRVLAPLSRSERKTLVRMLTRVLEHHTAD